MSETGPEGGWTMARDAMRKFPSGLAGMLALVVCVEAMISGHAQTLRNAWAWDWFLAEKAARREVADSRVLCFGDSLMKFAVAPEALERSSGRKAYNLAVGVGQVPGSYFLLRRALESGAKPEAVVIDAIPHMLSARPDANATLWPELMTYRDCLELSWRSGDAQFFASTGLAKLLPSVRERFEIRGAVTRALNDQPSPVADIIKAFVRNWTVNRGAQMTRRPAVTPPDQVAAWLPCILPETWETTPLNAEYLRRFFALARSRGIRAYWLLPPFDPAVQSLREVRGLDANYVAFIHSIQAEFPEVVVLDARYCGYNTSEHIDPIHLDVRGAASLSRDLGAILRKDPASLARWEMMPPFRDASAEVALEDVDQSAEIIMRQKTIR